MDVDISDILASVSAPAIPQRTLDLQALTRAWINERSSPELLPYPTALIERCTNAVKSQIEIIEDMSGAMDPASNFTLVILQTELERVKFLLRSFLRARIAKIDKYPIHYRDHPGSEDQPTLSPLESRYLESHSALLSSHYHSSFLSQFPTQLQKLDDTGGGISMVDKPDEDTAVFCRVLRDGYALRPVDDDIELKRGDVWVLRWSAVKESVRKGDVELI
ncbi:dna replication complex gins sld5 [Lecanosticta acicola]|uniref:DNA replication complex GINS protein SLD5 n=1 Tax=Lecanosticta acicola TaxID=111012 RepID=A0AAI8YY47_9PEZI|nr:dna replication complex gins sld5 [Lecanosticta acicola]